MTIGDKLLLGVNTTIIGMGIVFIVLIALCLIVMLESYLLKDANTKKTTGSAPQIAESNAVQKPAISQNQKKGMTSGQAKIESTASDEELAAIMACVSFDADIPLNQLKIKQIRLIEE